MYEYVKCKSVTAFLCFQAAMGIAELIIMAMEKEGLPREQCIKKIWMVDSKGLIVKVRSSLKAMFFTFSVDIQTHHVVCIGVYKPLIQSC